MSEEKNPRDMTTKEYLDWLDETGQDVDQFDLADEEAEREAGVPKPSEEPNTESKRP